MWSIIRPEELTAWMRWAQGDAKVRKRYIVEFWGGEYSSGDWQEVGSGDVVDLRSKAATKWLQAHGLPNDRDLDPGFEDVRRKSFLFSTIVYFVCYTSEEMVTD